MKNKYGEDSSKYMTREEMKTYKDLLYKEDTARVNLKLRKHYTAGSYIPLEGELPGE